MPNFNPYSNYNEPHILDDDDYVDNYAFNYGANMPATDIDLIPMPVSSFASPSASGVDWKKLLLIAGAALVVVKVL